jgi:hypothetical protein
LRFDLIWGPHMETYHPNNASRKDHDRSLLHM